MKYIGKLVSNKGHGRVDLLVRMSLNELEVLNQLVVKPFVKSNKNYPIKGIVLTEAHRELRKTLAPLIRKLQCQKIASKED